MDRRRMGRSDPRPIIRAVPRPRRGRHAFRRSSVVERAAVNRLVVGSNPTAGATLTLNLASFGRSGHVFAAQIWPKMTLRMTLSQGSLENLTASRCWAALTWL